VKTSIGFFSFWHLSVNPSDAFYQQTLIGVINGLSHQKYHLLVDNLYGFLSKKNQELDFLQESTLAGVIIMAPRVKKEKLSFLKDVNVPVVLLFHRNNNKDISWVDLDNVNGAKMATEHLISLGHKRIGFINGEKEHASNAMDRYIGYQSALSQAGIEENPDLVKHGIFAEEFGTKATEQLLALPKKQRPTAIFCATDMIAFGSALKAREMGVKIPEQLSIVGFDDNERAAMNNPPLTTIRQPFFDLGRVAVEALVSIIQDPNHTPKQILIEPQLIIRQTTTPPQEEN
jgi:LacI family transcriptional regulator